MIKDAGKIDEMNLSLLEIVATQDPKEHCEKIADWLKQHYHVDEAGFLVKDNRSIQPYFFTESITKDIVQDLVETLPRAHLEKATGKDALLFGLKEGKPSFFSQQEDIDSHEPMGLSVPLTIQGRSIGVLALLTKSTTIQGLTPETPELLSFIPLISYLIDNIVSHERKDKKIRMLNLYQTVSSALSHIEDLYELLTTIVSIVTTELLCEECSVLLYDEDNNELVFFTAVGETGMQLEKLRFPANRGIAGRALRERTTQIVNDAQSHPDFYRSLDENHNFKTKTILAAPIISGDVLVGVINAINKIENKYFDKEDDQILSAIADEVALAVKNAKLFDFVVDSYCKIRQGLNSCKGCKRPLKSWTPCVSHLKLV